MAGSLSSKFDVKLTPANTMAKTGTNLKSAVKPKLKFGVASKSAPFQTPAAQGNVSRFGSFKTPAPAQMTPMSLKFGDRKDKGRVVASINPQVPADVPQTASREVDLDYHIP